MFELPDRQHPYFFTLFTGTPNTVEFAGMSLVHEAADAYCRVFPYCHAWHCHAVAPYIAVLLKKRPCLAKPYPSRHQQQRGDYKGERQYKKRPKILLAAPSAFFIISNALTLPQEVSCHGVFLNIQPRFYPKLSFPPASCRQVRKRLAAPP